MLLVKAAVPSTKASPESKSYTCPLVIGEVVIVTPVQESVTVTEKVKIATETYEATCPFKSMEYVAALAGSPVYTLTWEPDIEKMLSAVVDVPDTNNE